MVGKLFILRHVAGFAPGFFDNTAIENGGIVLSRQGAGFAAQGSYTSAVLPCQDFFSLMPSWNADVPFGADVEMQIRVSVEGTWSGWMSFGRWSPYIRRASPSTKTDAIARCEGEILTLADGCPPAAAAQMRILLRAGDAPVSPKVYLLAISTNATQTVRQEAPSFDRRLSLPAYSCLVRDPGITWQMASATTLCMMLNRYGSDLLPEEVARTAYDFGTGSYSNLAYLCAAAGALGYFSYLGYASLALLRREVWQGCAVAARVHYRAPAPGGEAPFADSARPLPPILEDASRDSAGHLVAIYGFFKRDGADFVLLNNPLAGSDHTVAVEMPLATFASIYTGLALFVEKGPPDAGLYAPRRVPARLEEAGGRLRLCARSGEELMPAGLASEALNPCTLCCTLSDGTAYASAAQHKFYYPEPGEYPAGPGQAAGRITFYLIGPQGNWWVAEKSYENLIY